MTELSTPEALVEALAGLADNETLLLRAANLIDCGTAKHCEYFFHSKRVSGRYVPAQCARETEEGRGCLADDATSLRILAGKLRGAVAPLLATLYQVTAERDAEKARADRIDAKLGELNAAVRECLPPVDTLIAERQAAEASLAAANAELAQLRAEGEAKDRRIALADRVKAQLEVAQNALCKIDRGGKPMRDIAAQALLDIAMVPYPEEPTALARAATAREGEPMGRLSRRERQQLRWLRDNPGSWGGHLDRGDPCSDPEMKRWIAEGWIESRPHVRTIGRYTTIYGYFLTDAGQAALNREEADRE